MIPAVNSDRDARRLNVLGVEHIVRISGAHTNGALTLLEVASPANAGIPLHVHMREDEVFHVLAGELHVTVGGQNSLAQPGTTVFAPRNIPHTFRAGAQGARILVVVQPSGIEAMFAELHQLPAGPPDMSRVAEICGRYGISFLG